MIVDTLIAWKKGTVWDACPSLFSIILASTSLTGCKLIGQMQTGVIEFPTPPEDRRWLVSVIAAITTSDCAATERRITGALAVFHRSPFHDKSKGLGWS